MQNWQIQSAGGGIRSKVFHNIFEKIISLDNLFIAWDEFKKRKRKKPDVQEFEYNLEDNIFNLRQELKTQTYSHSDYTPFNICDPKPRKIHKATVRDRVLHHAVFRILYPIFNRTFIFDSYSCRNGKGTHRAISRLKYFAGKVSKNNTKNCFVLKCDIKRFFDSVSQNILLELIKKKIQDKKAVWLVEEIVRSFAAALGKGLPLGNVTSQLFANIYLNELDQFIKHNLKARYYIRYCDDFVVLSHDKEYLKDVIPKIDRFLKNRLKLSLHPDKISIRKYHQGIDFLGYVGFPYHRTLRTKTKRRMLKRIEKKTEEIRQGRITEQSFNQTVQSYFGILKHCNGYKLEKEIQTKFIDIMKKTFLSQSAEQTKKLGEKIAKEVLKNKNPKRAFIIGLEGELGGGKTTFLQGFAKGLGVKEKVLSPTFVILKKLKIKNTNQNLKILRYKILYHIDCYRIKKPKELLDLDFKEIISNPQNIVVIEWAERVKKIMPKDTFWIKFKFRDEKTREIKF